MERLWDYLDKASPLQTFKVQQVETENKQLKNKLEEMEKKIFEGKIILFKENRKGTIKELREIADFIDLSCKITGIGKVILKQFKRVMNMQHLKLLSQVLGSSGSVAAGAMTLAGGILTLASSGLAAPALLGGLVTGLGSGITGGVSAVAKKIIESSQMKNCQRAIEADAESTKDFARQVESIRKKLDQYGVKDQGVLYASSTIRGVGIGIGSDVVKGAGSLAKLFGDDAAKVLLSSTGRVLTGSVTAVVGGVMIPWDLYNLSNGIHDLLSGDMSEASKQIRLIADQLEKELNDMTANGQEE